MDFAEYAWFESFGLSQLADELSKNRRNSNWFFMRQKVWTFINSSYTSTDCSAELAA